jgi:hypothetical protein
MAHHRKLISRHMVVLTNSRNALYFPSQLETPTASINKHISSGGSKLHQSTEIDF